MLMMYRCSDSAHAAALVYTLKMRVMDNERGMCFLPSETSNRVRTDGSISDTHTKFLGTLTRTYRCFNSAVAVILALKCRTRLMNSEKVSYSLPPGTSNCIQTDGSTTSTLETTSTCIHVCRVPKHPNCWLMRSITPPALEVCVWDIIVASMAGLNDS
jgi:hypothetical protein